MASLGFVACATSRAPETRPGSEVVVLPRVAESEPPEPEQVADASVDATDASDASADAQAVEPPLVVRDEPTRLPSGRSLAGPCVTPAVHAAETNRIEGYRLDSAFFAPREVDIDLDGDGERDIFLNGGASRDTVTIHLYVHRNGCGYSVGSIDAVVGMVEALPTKTQGLSDLRVTQDLCEAKTKSLACRVVYTFDGKRYRPTSYKATKTSMREP